MKKYINYKWGILFFILLLVVTIIHYVFFKIDQRPAVDHDGWHTSNVITYYKYLEEKGITIDFFKIPFLSNVALYGQAFPPFIPMFLALALYFFGLNLFVYKMVNVCFLWILLGAVYLIGKRIEDSRVGFFSAYITATMPLIINFSRKSFLFFPQMSFVVLAFYLFIKTEDFENRKYTIYFSFALLLAGLIHYSTLIYFSLFFLIYVATGKFSKAKILNGLCGFMIPIIFCFSWYKKYLFPYLEYKRVGQGPLIADNHILAYLVCIKDFLNEMLSGYMFPLYFYLFIAVLPVIVIVFFKYVSEHNVLFMMAVFSIVPIQLAIYFNYPKNYYFFFDFQVFMPFMIILAVTSISIFVRNLCKKRTVKIVLLLICFLIITNGTLILAIPFATNLSKTCSQEILKEQTVFLKTTQILIPKKNYNHVLNFIYADRQRFKILDQIVTYFVDEYRNSKEKYLKCQYVGVLNELANNIALNCFLNGVYIILFQNLVNVDESYVLIALQDNVTNIFINKTDVKLKNILYGEYGKVTRNDIFLNGFMLERKIDIEDQHRLGITAKKVYILKKITK